MITQEQELVLFKHFFNQLCLFLNCDDSDMVTKRLEKLVRNPLRETEQVDSINMATVNEFIKKYKNGADLIRTTGVGIEARVSLDRLGFGHAHDLSTEENKFFCEFFGK